MTKKLVFLLFALSSQAFAWDGDLSWEEIFSYPHLRLEHEAKLGALTLDNACLTDTEILSLDDVRYCAELEKVQKGENKDKWNDWVCVRYVTGPYAHPRYSLPQSIPVRVTISKGAGHQAIAFQKYFTFPNCH